MTGAQRSKSCLVNSKIIPHTRSVDCSSKLYIAKDLKKKKKVAKEFTFLSKIGNLKLN